MTFQELKSAFWKTHTLCFLTFKNWNRLKKLRSYLDLHFVSEKGGFAFILTMDKEVGRILKLGSLQLIFFSPKKFLASIELDFLPVSLENHIILHLFQTRKIHYYSTINNTFFIFIDGPLLHSKNHSEFYDWKNLAMVATLVED